MCERSGSSLPRWKPMLGASSRRTTASRLTSTPSSARRPGISSSPRTASRPRSGCSGRAPRERQRRRWRASYTSRWRRKNSTRRLAHCSGAWTEAFSWEATSSGLRTAWWGQKGYPFRRAFLDIAREDYGADAQEADFHGDPESARHSVNAWVEQRTNSKIRDLFPQGSIGPDTRLVLGNAIYFKGLWAQPFDKQKTTDSPFHVMGDSEIVSVPTMSQDDHFRITESVELQMLELPYKGKDLSMLILLPRRIDGLADLEAEL